MGLLKVQNGWKAFSANLKSNQKSWGQPTQLGPTRRAETNQKNRDQPEELSQPEENQERGSIRSLEKLESIQCQPEVESGKRSLGEKTTLASGGIFQKRNLCQIDIGVFFSATLKIIVT